MPLNLNDIKQQLIGYFSDHGQINDVKYEDDFDFAAEPELTYPVAHVQHVSSSSSGKMTTHNFQVTLADLTDQNIQGIEDEIYSDLLEIADEFGAWLYQQNDWSYDRVMSIQKFVEGHKDRTAGITFVVRLSVVRRNNPCQTPAKI